MGRRLEEVEASRVQADTDTSKAQDSKAELQHLKDAHEFQLTDIREQIELEAKTSAERLESSERAHASEMEALRAENQELSTKLSELEARNQSQDLSEKLSA